MLTFLATMLGMIFYREHWLDVLCGGLSSVMLIVKGAIFASVASWVMRRPGRSVPEPTRRAGFAFGGALGAILLPVGYGLGRELSFHAVGYALALAPVGFLLFGALWALAAWVTWRADREDDSPEA